MSTGPVPRSPREDGPVLFLPEVDVPHLSDLQVTCDMWSARARQRREHALELKSIAQLAHRRRGGELATAGGRGGPGVDARALADPLRPWLDDQAPPDPEHS